MSAALNISCTFLLDTDSLCPSSVPSTDYHPSRNPGTGDSAVELHDWLSFWWLKLCKEKLFVANQRELTQPGKGWPGAVTPRLTPQMGRPESPKRPIYCLSLSACVKEGENWAVVNLMFPGNQVILCSRSLKGNSCFPAPLPSCSRGHPALCLLQLLALGAVESEDGYSFSTFLQMLWGRARKHKKRALLMVRNR